MAHAITHLAMLRLAHMYLPDDASESVHRAVTLAPVELTECMEGESMAGLCRGITTITEADMAALALRASNRALKRLATPAEAMS
jgi:hypothetical protein